MLQFFKLLSKNKTVIWNTRLIFTDKFFALTSFIKCITMSSDICQNDKLLRHFQQEQLLGLK